MNACRTALKALGMPLLASLAGHAGPGARRRPLPSFVVRPEADRVLKRTPMYQLDQLKPIARFAADPTVQVVRADSPWNTYAEFIAHVKSNPARVSFGSSDNYGTIHIPMEPLKATTSSYMLHVPYTGAGPCRAGFAVRTGGCVVHWPRQRRAVHQGGQAAGAGALGRGPIGGVA